MIVTNICPIMSGDSPDVEFVECQGTKCRFWQQPTEREGDGECAIVVLSIGAYAVMRAMASPMVVVQPNQETEREDA